MATVWGLHWVKQLVPRLGGPRVPLTVLQWVNWLALLSVRPSATKLVMRTD